MPATIGNKFKRLILKLSGSHFIFFLIVTAVIIGLNLTPLILQSRHAPTGRTFSLIHNNVQDFYFYQSIMNEGANGSWLTSDPYTNVTHQPSIIFAYFVWLGKLSHLLGISYALMYHLCRIVLSILFFAAAYRLLLLLKIPYPRAAYLFFLFETPLIRNTVNGPIPFMNWWTGMDPIRRAGYLPHHMFGGLFLILTIICLIKFFDVQKVKYLAMMVLFAFLLAFVHTPSLFILLIIIPPALIIYLILNAKSYYAGDVRRGAPPAGPPAGGLRVAVRAGSGRTRVNILSSKLTTGLFIFWVIGFLTLLIMVLQTGRGFPWSQYIAWEKDLQLPILPELPGALGILIPAALIGTVITIASKRFNRILIVSWLIIPYLFIPFARKLNISDIRLVQGVPYLPLAILSILGLNIVQEVVKVIIRTKVNIRFIGNHALMGIFLIIFTLLTYPAINWSVRDQIREYWPIYSNVYLDNRIFGAFSFVNRTLPAKTVTLSTFYTGNYLPVFTNTKSFMGHSGYTADVNNKEILVNQFFKGKMTATQANKFLTDNKITLVFQGPDEKPLTENLLYPEILKPVYNQPAVTLYVLK
jgi:hypothetical protein